MNFCEECGKLLKKWESLICNACENEEKLFEEINDDYEEFEKYEEERANTRPPKDEETYL